MCLRNPNFGSPTLYKKEDRPGYKFSIFGKRPIYVGLFDTPILVPQLDLKMDDRQMDPIGSVLEGGSGGH